MLRASLCLAAGGLLALLAPAGAHAKCAAPRTVFAPAAGAAIPADPTIHVFLTNAAGAGADLTARVTVLADGAPIAAAIEIASRDSGGDLVALRVRPSAAGHAHVTVQVDGGDGGEATYSIDRRWRAPRRPAVALGGVTREIDAWTCSHTDAYALELDSQAAAYRIEWATAPESWDTGAQAIQILPRSRDAFWDRAVPARSGASVIGLGFLSCLGETIPETALAGPLYVRITGLFADGSETARWAAPVPLTARDAPTAAAAEARPPAPTEEPEVVTPRPAPQASPVAASQRTGLVVLLLAAALLALLVVRAVSRRASCAAPPPR